MCKCGRETETTLLFFSRRRLYSTVRKKLLDDIYIYTVASSLKNYSDEKLLNTVLYGSEYLPIKTNQSILKFTIYHYCTSS